MSIIYANKLDIRRKHRTFVFCQAVPPPFTTSRILFVQSEKEH